MKRPTIPAPSSRICGPLQVQDEPHGRSLFSESQHIMQASSVVVGMLIDVVPVVDSVGTIAVDILVVASIDGAVVVGSIDVVGKHNLL